MNNREDDGSGLDADTRSSSGGIPTVGPALVPGLTLLFHSDPGRIGERAPLLDLASGRTEEISRLRPSFSRLRSGARPLAEPHVSRRLLHARAMGGGVRLESDEAAKPGTVFVDGVTLSGSLELSAEQVARGVVLRFGSHVVLLLHPLDPGPQEGGTLLGLVGDSAPVATLRRRIRRVATLDIPVLITGETGSGKELVARAIHDEGPRRGRPYVAVNMAAVPPTLAPSELFGVGRGAFTGAERSRTGYFGRADGGTLFLDEVGETPLEVQAALLRTLETGDVQPVGGDAFRVDVRVLAATDADLESALVDGRFRAPLFHRLAGERVAVPPLREHREDLGVLVRHFLGDSVSSCLTAARVERMALHAWPGNVRELRNVAARLRSGEAEEWDGPAPPAAASRPLSVVRSAAAAPNAVRRRAHEVDDRTLLESLRAHGWRLKPVADALGLSRSSLYDRLDGGGDRTVASLSRNEIEASLGRHAGDVEAAASQLGVSSLGLARRLHQLRMGVGE